MKKHKNSNYKQVDYNVKVKKNNAKTVRIVIVLLLAMLFMLYILANRSHADKQMAVAKIMTSLVLKISAPVLCAGCIAATIFLFVKSIDTSRWYVTPFMGAGVFAFLTFESFVTFSNVFTAFQNSITFTIIAVILYVLYLLYFRYFVKTKK